MRCVLAIAGSDSSGGAGIQADLRAISAHGLHGLSVITAVTAQNSRVVEAIHRVPARHLLAQLQAVFADFEVAAVKIGMLGGTAAISAVADCLREAGARNIVLDPVLVSSSGTPLLPASGLRKLRGGLIPIVDLLTPNLPEAEALLGRRLNSDRDMRRAADDLIALGARAVLLKGGHRRGSTVVDHLVDHESATSFSHPRLSGSVRGTGCTLASAIACGLALGLPLRAAVHGAEQFLQREMRRAGQTGHGRMRAMNPLQAHPRPAGTHGKR
ncbi:MAG TPA: bifunctional hydroxymethylpyrimidine kinase/phosphomethylpyrimidine kinase [Rudaea sp.]|nr:bifunctional hydroxymethylpyrimidine kinase/phosphomethylpyrimidine kinase [Rudaea sp.]